jgi:hypothetical protein
MCQRNHRVDGVSRAGAVGGQIDEQHPTIVAQGYDIQRQASHRW